MAFADPLPDGSGREPSAASQVRFWLRRQRVLRLISGIRSTPAYPKHLAVRRVAGGLRRTQEVVRCGLSRYESADRKPGVGVEKRLQPRHRPRRSTPAWPSRLGGGWRVAAGSGSRSTTMARHGTDRTTVDVGEVDAGVPNRSLAVAVPAQGHVVPWARPGSCRRGPRALPSAAVPGSRRTRACRLASASGRGGRFAGMWGSQGGGGASPTLRRFHRRCLPRGSAHRAALAAPSQCIPTRCPRG